MSQDPIGFAAGDANLYRYVGNSAANFRDPTGLEGWGEWILSWFGITPEGAAAASYYANDGFIQDGRANRSRLEELARPGALSSAQRDLPAEYFGGPRFSPDAINCIQQLANLGVGASIGRVRGYSSFSAFKRAMGPARRGYQWHHIVEQSKVGEFAAEEIHNTANVVQVPAAVNQRLNAFYSSKRWFTFGKTVREWLSGQSFEDQYKFGLKEMLRIMREWCNEQTRRPGR